jgi:hypothetical protein
MSKIVEVFVDPGGPSIIEVVERGPQGIQGPPGDATPIAANSLLGNDTNATALPTAIPFGDVPALIGVPTNAQLTSALSPYLTIANAATTYLALTGGTLTGSLQTTALETRNGTSPTSVTIQNTWTSNTNRETGFVRWVSNILRIGTEKGTSGGLARALELQTDGVTRLTIATDGNITQNTANSSYTFNQDGTFNASRFYLRPNGGSLAVGVAIMPNNSQTNSQASALYIQAGMSSSDSGVQRPVELAITYNQSGSAGSSDLYIRRIETALGSGTHWFQRHVVNSDTDFRWGVQNTGKPIFRANGSVTLNVNQTMSFEATANTVGNIVYRGSDGVTRRAGIPLTDQSLLVASFEAYNQNIFGFPIASTTFTGSRLDSMTYTSPAGSITRTFNYTGTKITSIVLSGAVPSGIPLTKTIVYDGDLISETSYS